MGVRYVVHWKDKLFDQVHKFQEFQLVKNADCFFLTATNLRDFFADDRPLLFTSQI